MRSALGLTGFSLPHLLRLPRSTVRVRCGASGLVPTAEAERPLSVRKNEPAATFTSGESLDDLRYFASARKNWFVYSKPPFAGPEAVLAYLARYTHRVAISNTRLVSFDERGVSFRFKDYRRNGQARYGTMTLSADEFIRRFLLHVLPKGFHRIRHYGLLASAGCKTNIARQAVGGRSNGRG
jgi:Putative transposase